MEQVSESVGIVTSSLKGLSESGRNSMQGVTETALSFADTFGTEVEESVQTVSTLMSTGLVKDATQGFDLMTTAFQKVPAAMRGELPEILHEYGVNFQGLGFSGEQAFNLLVNASQKGKFALDKTGDALKEFSLIAVSAGQDEGLTEAFADIGLNATDMSKAIAEGGPGAQKALQDTAKGLLQITDPAERANTAVQLFGTPLEDLSVDQIPAFLEGLAGGQNNMEGFAGSAERMGETLNDNGTAKLEEFKRSLQGGLNDAVAKATTAVMDFSGWVKDNGVAVGVTAGILGVTLAPALITAAVGWAQTGIAATRSAATQLAASYRTVGGWIAMSASAVANAATTTAAWVASGVRSAAAWVALKAQAVASFVATAASAVMQGAVVAGAWVASSARTVAALTAQGIAFVAQKTAMVAGAVATGVMTAAQWALNSALLANPMTWIVVGIMALIAAIVLIATKTTWFQTAWEAVWNTVKAVFTAAWNGIKAAFEFVWNFIKNNWGTILAVLTGPIGIAVAVIVKYWDQIKAGFQAVWNFIANLGSTIWDTFRDGASAVKDWIAQKWDEVIGFFTGLPGRIKSAVAGLFDPIKNTFRDAINWVIAKWNDFSLGFKFTIPIINKEVSFNVNTPDLPMLAGGGRAGVDKHGKLYGPGTGTSDSILGIDRLTGMPTAFVSNREGVVKESAMDAGGDAVVAALNAGWVPSADYLHGMLPGFASGGRVGEPYGLPTGTSISYGGSGFPDWVTELGKKFDVKPSTYPGHQESDRGEAGYAPNPQHLNRGIDWSGTVDAMQGFADHLMSIAPNFDGLEQIIWQNPGTGKKSGWAGRSADTSGSYFAADYGGHQDHVHTRQSSAFGAATVDLGPVPPVVQATPTDPSTPTPIPETPATPTTPTTPTEPERAFSGRDRFKQLFTDLGGIAADSLIDIVGVGDWLDLADRYTIKSSDTAQTSATPPAETPAAPNAQTPAAPETPDSSQTPQAQVTPAVVTPVEPTMPTDVPEGGIAAGSPGAKEAFWKEWASYPGWRDQNQWFDTLRLFNGESGWNALAQNPSSTAFGVGQFLDTTWATVGEAKSDDVAVQARATAKYIKQRPDYGTPSKAWELWQSRSPHWYDQGGWLPEGLNLTMNATGGPEPILEQSQWDVAADAISTVKELAMSGAGVGGGGTTVINATFRDEAAFYAERRREARLGMTRYGSGRRRR
nr:hypothetical protein [Gordonia desulfuricans]